MNSGTAIWSAMLAGMGESWAVDRSSTRRLRHANFLALRIGHDQDLALLAEQQARDDLAVLEGEVRDAEALVDVAIGVQDVLQQPSSPRLPMPSSWGPTLAPLPSS